MENEKKIKVIMLEPGKLARTAEIDASLAGMHLVISHQERILEIADYIVVIADGNVRAFGEGKDVLPQLLKEEKESKCPLGKDKKGENN